MLAALAIALLSQTPDCLRDVRCRGVRSLGRDAHPRFAFFEFAPAGGAGIGAACACAAVTGAKGEAMTFTRGSSGTCLKTVGTSPQAIASGDLVTCTSNQARVMPGSDGTSINGILIETARTNVVLRSEALDNAAWANFTAGSGTNPTKGSADTDTDPYGTTLAEHVTFNATGASDSSGLQQTALSGVVYSCQLWARGNATTGSGTFDFCADKASGQQCVACSYVLGQWTQCLNLNFTSKASGVVYVGNLSSLNGGTTRSGQTPTIFGLDCEAGAFASSYIATAGSTVARSADLGSFAPTFPASTTFSIASTVVLEGAAATNDMEIGEVYSDASNLYQLYSNSSTFTAYLKVGGSFGINSSAGSPSHNLTTSTSNRLAFSYSGGTTASICVAGACGAITATSFAPLSGAVPVYLASTHSGSQGNAVVKRFCYDPSPTRCQ